VATSVLTLKPFQQEGVAWLQDRDNAALFDEAGLGKTAQMLGAAEEPVVVVAPAMVLDSGTWDDEIDKWAPGMEVTQVSYSSLSQRGPRGQVPRDANGFPQTPPKAEYVKVLKDGGTLILDESHYIKGRKTNWSVACEKLARYADRTIQATGTPIPNWAFEAFMSLRILRPDQAHAGKDLGSYWRWVKEWYDVGPSRWNPRAQEINGFREDRTWDEFYEENWGDDMLRRYRHEVLTELPPLTWTGHQGPSDPHELWRVDMTKAQAKVYRELKRDFITWLDSGAEVAAWSTPGLMVKLAKAATGLQTLDPTIDESGKLDVLKTILADRPMPTLVVGHFRDTVEASHRAALEVGRSSAFLHGGTPHGQRQHLIRSFQSGNLDVLCASIELISEGMTLHQGGADMVIRVERSWRPSKNEQVIRRLHRLGQKRPVTAIDLVSRKTVDERVLALLMMKTDEQMLALGREDLRGLVL
jgi:hypothetical protein